MSFGSLQRYKWLSTYCYSSPLVDIKISEFKGIHVVEWINWLKTSATINKRRNSFRGELKFLNTIPTWYKDFLNEDFNVPVTKKHKQLCTLMATKNLSAVQASLVGPTDRGFYKVKITKSFNKKPLLLPITNLSSLQNYVTIFDINNNKIIDISIKMIDISIILLYHV